MRSRRRWTDLSGPERTGIVLLAGLQLTLLGAALTDLRRRRADELTGPRWAWTAASFVNFVGPIAYFLVGRRRSRPSEARAA